MKKLLFLISMCCLLMGVGCSTLRSKLCTVTYWNGEAVFYREEIAPGESLNLKEKTFPEGNPVKADTEEESFLFSGWAYSPNGEKLESVQVSRDIALHALFTPQAKSPETMEYTVTFLVDTGSGEEVLAEEKVKAGQTVVPPEAPERTGYTFTGWDQDISCPITKRTEFRAVYEKNHYSLFYHVLGQISEESVEYDEEILLQYPALSAAFNFDGWFAEQTYETPFAVSKMPSSNLHVYGKCSVNFSGAHLIIPANAVYGQESTVRIGDLKTQEGLSYAYEWQDGSTAENFPIFNAGSYDLSVKITATYEFENGRIQSEQTLTGKAEVAKKPLSLTLTVNSVEYGTDPSPELRAEGYLGEFLAPGFVYTGEEGVSFFPLSAGTYTVTADLQGLDNYEFTIPSATLEVTKKQLIVSASAADLQYGQQPTPVLSYEGFISGENESVLTVSGAFVQYDVIGRFNAGRHTLSVCPQAFSAKNYEVKAGEETSFEVQKAAMDVGVTLTKDLLVYGENPSAQVTHTPFVYEDETEEEVFGGEIAVAYSSDRFSVGSYTAQPEVATELENYIVTIQTANFTVSPKEVRVSHAPIETVFGREITLPEPNIEGLIEGEESLAEEIKGDLVYSVEGQEIDRFLPTGTYPIEIAFEGTLENYTLICENGEITVKKRPFEISSGQVFQNRNMRWSIEVQLSGEDAELFRAEGRLELDTADSGTYTANEESALSANHYVWTTPLKFMLQSGEDVTENFEIAYALSVTLNNSHFNITVPSSGLEFVYDGKEHEFLVTVAVEESESGVLTPSVLYKVNGTESKPVVKNAGTYEIQCEISAMNYETETRSYTVTVQKASYILEGDREDFTAPYNGKAQGRALSLKGVAGEDLTGDLAISAEYTPYVGQKETLIGNNPPLRAGIYQISYEAKGNPNYEDISGHFKVTIERIPYTVSKEDQVYTYAPGQSFGKGVGVEAIEGNSYTVTYDYNGSTTASVPAFSEATETTTIVYTVSEGINYETASGSYTVTVNKAKGELDLSGIRKEYVYSGSEQRVEGAASNNHQDAQITYENNVFTTVSQGNALVVKVKLAEGRNYTGDEKQISGFSVSKKTFSSLPIETPNPEEQYNRKGKLLKNVPLPEGFRWEEESESLNLGRNSYPAIYDPDPENINPFSLTVSFVTRRERVRAVITGCEANFGSLGDYAKVSLLGEDETTILDEDGFVTLSTQQQIDPNKGGTYPVVCRLSLKTNDYFELNGQTEKTVPFKLKTVEADGELFTVEDALNHLEQGTAKVLHPTEFLTAQTLEALGENPYEGAGYRTVKAGVTLLVPCKDGDDGTTTQNQKLSQSAVSGSGYSTLGLDSGELTVEGKLIVNALRSSDGQRTSMVVGKNFGCLEIKEGATVRIKEGGEFESMGFTFGDGSVIAESGAKVYEPFSMVGWKGGSISSAVRNTVFPLNQYALSSLICKTTFQSGSSYLLRASVSATLSILGGEQNLDLAVAFLGGDSAFLELKEGEISKEVRSSDGKSVFEAKGNFTFHNLGLELSSSIKFNTAGLQVPIPGNLSITLKEGCRGDLPENVALKLLPGASVVVEEGAELTLHSGGKVYSYGNGNTELLDLNQWQDGGNGMAYPHSALKEAYFQSVSDFGYTAKTPAELKIDGTLVTESGSVLCAQLTGSGTVQVAEGTTLSSTIQEDKTPQITGNWEKLQALSGKGGQYFNVVLKGYLRDQELKSGSYQLKEKSAAWKR